MGVAAHGSGLAPGFGHGPGFAWHLPDNPTTYLLFSR